MTWIVQLSVLMGGDGQPLDLHQIAPLKFFRWSTRRATTQPVRRAARGSFDRVVLAVPRLALGPRAGP
jgi:hypothetical protein